MFSSLVSVFLLVGCVSAGSLAEHLEGHGRVLASSVSSFGSFMEEFCVDTTTGVAPAAADGPKDTMSCSLGASAAEEAFGIATAACVVDTTVAPFCSELKCLTGMSKVLASFSTCLSTESKGSACDQVAASIEKGIHTSKDVLEICNIDSRKLGGVHDEEGSGRHLDIYSDRVQLYSSINFKGTYYFATYCTNPYYGAICGYDHITASGMPNNKLSSIKAGFYIDVYLYGGYNYLAYLGVLGNGYQIADLGRWDNIVSSFKMEYFY